MVEKEKEKVTKETHLSKKKGKRRNDRQFHIQLSLKLLQKSKKMRLLHVANSMQMD